jgi:hypothetical protein
MVARQNTVVAIRVAGLLLVALVSLYGAARSGESGAYATAVVGVLPLVGFLWLCVSGWFTWGSACRSDWVALPPFLLALVVREAFTLHSLQEIVIYFARGPVGRHSIVYPLLQMFFVPLVSDSQAFVFHMNGVLGALATLPLYLFVRQRTGSRTAGFLSALFLATHPVVARFSPTDGPYSMLLVCWFSGLALLSAPAMDGRALFGGAVLLGIAATCRMEGALYLVASLFLLDVRAIVGGARRHPGSAALSLLAVALLGAVHMYFLLPFHLGGPTPMTSLIPPLEPLRKNAIFPASYNDRLFMALVLIGGVAGLVSRRQRLGLYAYVAMLIVLSPVADSGFWILAMHRMVPTCALQTICAGIGAWWLAAWLPSRRGLAWAAAVPGALVACYGLVLHRQELTERYVFNEEYDLVRSHLGPGGNPPSGPPNVIVQSEPSRSGSAKLPPTTGHCSLLTCNQVAGQDVDIHDFGHVVPGMTIVDCLRNDCVATVAGGGCFYYVRSAGCYFHSAGIPPSCAGDQAAAPVDPQRCLTAPIATFEQSVLLQPIEMRRIDLLRTFGERSQNYPKQVLVGLFKVGPKTASGSSRP